MDFLLNESQRIFQKTMRDFCEKEINPDIARLDKEHIFSYEIYDKLVKIGLPGVMFPEKYGGSGFDLMTLVVAIEEIARISLGMAMAQGWVLFAPPIFYCGNEEQKKKYLTPVISGEIKGCFALTEPNAGSDVASIATTAEKGSNGYTVNGSKIFITNADVSDYMVLVARTGSTGDRHRGISLFIVDNRSAGITINRLPKIGAGACSTCEVGFQDVHVPLENLLGEENNGFYALMECLDVFRVVFGVMGVGVAQGAYEEALRYAKKRVAFGQPIGKFQAIQFMLSDMYTEIEASRLLVYRATWMVDQKMRASKEASAAKLMASETAMKTAVKAMQIFGAYGYMEEYPIQRYFREAKLLEVGEGTSEVQRMIIAKRLGL
jgi:hypothetical protein